jgi:hypothetical protein
MIHKALASLYNGYTPEEWLFLLALHELGKTDWFPRNEVIKAFVIDPRSKKFQDAARKLEQLRLIETKKDSSGLDNGTVLARVTKAGRDDLRVALKLSQI